MPLPMMVPTTMAQDWKTPRSRASSVRAEDGRLGGSVMRSEEYSGERERESYCGVVAGHEFRSARLIA